MVLGGFKFVLVVKHRGLAPRVAHNQKQSRDIKRTRPDLTGTEALVVENSFCFKYRRVYRSSYSFRGRIMFYTNEMFLISE